MVNYKLEELDEVLVSINSIIKRCEKAQLKFMNGTSQHTLLKNRIKALNISKLLISNKIDENHNLKVEYTREEMIEAIRPITSIINKCEKAQSKFVEGSTFHTRFKNMINVMNTSKSIITDEINKQ